MKQTPKDFDGDLSELANDAELDRLFKPEPVLPLGDKKQFTFSAKPEPTLRGDDGLTQKEFAAKAAIEDAKNPETTIPPIENLPATVSESKVEVVEHQEIAGGGIWGVDPELFKRQLEIADTNRRTLLEWLKKSMVEGIDYGSIHVVSKAKCPEGNECRNPAHWSKPCLFKPGGEKILAKLNFRAEIPEADIDKYIDAAIRGVDIKHIILKCVVYDSQGRVVGGGIGARSLAQDYGDLNKSLKMAQKSASLDGTIRTSGLSELFTVDLDDMKAEEDKRNEQRQQPATVVIQTTPVQQQQQSNYRQSPTPSDANKISTGQNKAIFAIVCGALKDAGTDTYSSHGKGMVRGFIDMLFNGDYHSATRDMAAVFIGQYAMGKNKADLIKIYNTFLEAIKH